MEKIDYHAGNVIIEAEKGNVFLFNKYNFSYPFKIYRGRINFMGGGKDRGDFSPEELVKREISEEFSIKEDKSYDEALLENLRGEKYSLPKIEKFASEDEINYVKKEILENMVSYQDFFVEFKNFVFNDYQPRKAIFSVFYSKVSDNFFNVVEKNIKEGKNLVNDGFLKIVKLEDILSRKILGAWITGLVLEKHLRTDIPNPEGTKIKPLGNPRKNFKEYLESFKYSKF